MINCSTGIRQVAEPDGANPWDRLGDLAVRRERPIEQWGYGAGIIAVVMRGGWTGRLWAEAAGTYAAILNHPVLAGLTAGRLNPELLTQYVVQDAHYLRDFARTLTVVASKAPTHAE